MTFFRLQWTELGKVWRAGYAEEVKRTALSFVILFLVALGGSLALPGLRSEVIGRISQLFGSMEILDEAGRVSAMALFSNNLQACLMVMLYGLIPYLRLPALALGINSMLLGVLLGHYLANGVSVLAYLAALLPHAVFELPALVLALAMGLFVCGQLTRRCRHDEAALPLGRCVVQISRMLLALSPLLAAAAVVEAYITPVVASLFY